MKSRLARKIAKIVFVYQNWDSNYQPYSAPQQQKMVSKIPFSVDAKRVILKYGVFYKVPTKCRRYNSMKIMQLMCRYNVHPKNVKEYCAFVRTMKVKGYNLL